MNGIINIYKEVEFTSHDVVAKLRGILHQKKIGHTGTLDPMAEGVLPVCCGRATKVCSLLTDKDKSYHVECHIGIETDTQDMTGAVLRKCDISGITAKDILNCVEQFKGDIMQIPPMYSALKVNGKKLYELAREGKTVDRNPRHVFISSIEITDINLEHGVFSMDVTCSKGTYMRTLCHDIGISLGAAAAMGKLVRTRVSVFKIEDAVTLSTVNQMAEKDFDSLDKLFMPVYKLFPEYSKFKIKDEFAVYLANGNKLSDEMLCALADSGQITDREKILVYDEQGVFKAIYEREKEIYKVSKML